LNCSRFSNHYSNEHPCQQDQNRSKCGGFVCTKVSGGFKRKKILADDFAFGVILLRDSRRATGNLRVRNQRVSQVVALAPEEQHVYSPEFQIFPLPWERHVKFTQSTWRSAGAQNYESFKAINMVLLRSTADQR
jgi:hypothetical protein